MKLIKRFFVMIFGLLLLSCHQTPPQQQPKKRVKKESQTTAKGLEMLTKEELLKQYQNVYEYQEEDSEQLLGVTVINANKIKFYLATKTLPCDTEYHGVAIRRYLDCFPTIEKDSLKELPKYQYIQLTAYYILTLNFTDEYKEAKISYQPIPEEETDCAPIEAILMTKTP
ncbi:hypothetical protein [Flavobacterium sp.]|uniref:hypothetical protein n=1 Tax=Flavobacterium sp. TaxID=239 RepID=UPI002FDA8223